MAFVKVNNQEITNGIQPDSDGLSQAEVLRLRQQYGENRLPVE